MGAQGQDIHSTLIINIYINIFHSFPHAGMKGGGVADSVLVWDMCGVLYGRNVTTTLSRSGYAAGWELCQGTVRRRHDPLE